MCAVYGFGTHVTQWLRYLCYISGRGFGTRATLASVPVLHLSAFRRRRSFLEYWSWSWS